MATNIGRVGMVMKGNYNSANTYSALDVVSYQQGLYVAKQNVPAGTTPANTTYWQAAITTGYPKTAIDITAAEGFEIGVNESYRIGDVCYISFNLTATNLITTRTECCAIGSNAAPGATKRFVCPAAPTSASALEKIATGYLGTNRIINIGDNNPGSKFFAINFSYVI